MLRNGRTHLNIQVNVNSIITISDILYNTTLIVLIQGMLIKSIHMTLQNISLSYTSFQQQFNRIHKLPCQTYKTDIGHFTAAQTHFLGLSSLHYSASHVKRLFWKFLKVQNYFLLIFDLNNYFFYFGFIHFVKYLRSCLQKKPERGM